MNGKAPFFLTLGNSPYTFPFLSDHTEFDEAQELFEALLKSDPYRVDGLDIYSNILYVKECFSALSYLAHKAVLTDKYRPETCCIIGERPSFFILPAVFYLFASLHSLHNAVSEALSQAVRSSVRRKGYF